MQRSRIQSVDGEAEAVADHGADQGTFNAISREGHSRVAGPAAEHWYQSRRVAVGKPAHIRDAAVTLVLLAAYACAAWLRQPALVIFCAAPLLWQLPCEQRWFGDRRRARAAARGASADLALLGTTWAIATWALWQHRLLPLLVCTAVVLLLLAERSTRRLAFPKRAGIL